MSRRKGELTDNELHLLRALEENNQYDLCGSDLHHLLHLYMSSGAVYMCLWRLEEQFGLTKHWTGLDSTSNRVLTFWKLTANGFATLVETRERITVDRHYWTIDKRRRGDAVPVTR